MPPQKVQFAADDVIARGAVVAFTASLREFWVQLEPDRVDVLDESVGSEKFAGLARLVPPSAGAALSVSRATAGNGRPSKR